MSNTKIPILNRLFLRIPTNNIVEVHGRKDLFSHIREFIKFLSCCIDYKWKSYSLYFGPPKILDMVNILAHSSSASTTARAWWISFPTVTIPWFFIIIALTFFSVFWSVNTLETVFARATDPDGLFETTIGFPTTILASSIICGNRSTDMATPSV